jgi:hypothetical protein
MKTATKKSAKEAETFDFRTIKTFEDACVKEGLNSEKIQAWIDAMPPELEYYKKSIRAVLRLEIKTKAVNGEWKARPGDSKQTKYYPWAWVLASGSGFVTSSCDYDLSHTNLGSRLLNESSEKALHVFETSPEENKDWYLNLK